MSSKKKLRPPVKIHGGKYYLSKWVLEHFPKGHAEMKYFEPFCGGASVFLNKERSEEEAISDVDKGLIAIFKALRDEPTEFISRLKRCKYQETTFKKAQRRLDKEFTDYIDQAVSEYIVRRMSRGGLKQAFAWSDRLRGGQPGDVNAWETMLEQLPLISERLQNVSVLNEPFEDVFKVWDEEDALCYLDPPYLPTTRAEGSQELYKHEMTVDDHVNMLNLIKNARGRVIISGYASPLYRTHLKEWKCKKRDIANHSGQGKNKERRVECLWFNF